MSSTIKTKEELLSVMNQLGIIGVINERFKSSLNKYLNDRTKKNYFNFGKPDSSHYQIRIDDMITLINENLVKSVTGAFGNYIISFLNQSVIKKTNLSDSNLQEEIGNIEDVTFSKVLEIVTKHHVKNTLSNEQIVKLINKQTILAIMGEGFNHVIFSKDLFSFLDDQILVYNIIRDLYTIYDIKPPLQQINDKINTLQTIMNQIKSKVGIEGFSINPQMSLFDFMFFATIIAILGYLVYRNRDVFCSNIQKIKLF